VDPDAEKLARSAVKAFEGGRYPEAHTQVDQAIAKSPGSARYESLRARILHAQGDHEGALEQLNAAVQHAPKDPEIYRQRASVNVALGRSAQARRDMAASSRLADGTSPSSPP
jgi:Tfp pilus assembly protein PilF